MSLSELKIHKDKIGLGLVVVIVLIVLFVMFKKPIHKFEHLVPTIMGKPSRHSTEVKQQEEPIQPMLFDAGSGTIVAGAGMETPQLMSPWYKAYTGNLKNYYLLDDGEDGAAGLQFNQCSKACCGDQPLPFSMPIEQSVCDSKDEFVPNPYTCNNSWQDTGCVCMTKKQAGFLGSRGGNA